MCRARGERANQEKTKKKQNKKNSRTSGTTHVCEHIKRGTFTPTVTILPAALSNSIHTEPALHKRCSTVTAHGLCLALGIEFLQKNAEMHTCAHTQMIKKENITIMGTTWRGGGTEETRMFI